MKTKENRPTKVSLFSIFHNTKSQKKGENEAEEARTPDNLIKSQVLYQLSYNPKYVPRLLQFLETSRQ